MGSAPLRCEAESDPGLVGGIGVMRPAEPGVEADCRKAPAPTSRVFSVFGKALESDDVDKDAERVATPRLGGGALITKIVQGVCSDECEDTCACFV